MANGGKIQDWKKGKRFAQQDVLRGIRKPMPKPSRPFQDDDDDDNWKKEVEEYQREQQQTQRTPNQP